MNNGSSARSKYDRCIYRQDLQLATDPFDYIMDADPYENWSRCAASETQVWKPVDTEIVDVESEIRGLGRPLTQCKSCKYDPRCRTHLSHTPFISGPMRPCISTFDPENPIVIPPYACPITFDNTAYLRRDMQPRRRSRVPGWGDEY